MVNRENMEKWINALETYDKEPARGMLMVQKDGETRMCAVGIGIDAMSPGSLVTHTAAAAFAFPAWLGLQMYIGVPLKPDGSDCDRVVVANDHGKQSPWTIAQRLRETYLKEES